MSLSPKLQPTEQTLHASSALETIMFIAYKARSMLKSQIHHQFPNINAAVIPVAQRQKIPPGPALTPTRISFFQGRYAPLLRACVAQKTS